MWNCGNLSEIQVQGETLPMLSINKNLSPPGQDWELLKLKVIGWTSDNKLWLITVNSLCKDSIVCISWETDLLVNNGEFFAIFPNGDIIEKITSLILYWFAKLTISWSLSWLYKCMTQPNLILELYLIKDCNPLTVLEKDLLTLTISREN